MAALTAQLISDLYRRALETSPVPEDEWLRAAFARTAPDPTVPRVSYRARLDRQPRNWRGTLIPRIEIVKRNVRILGKPPRPPRLPA